MAKRIRYHDQLKLQKRRHFMQKVLFVLFLILAACVGLGYLFFFTGLFDVRDISVNGAVTIPANVLLEDINENINAKFLGIKKSSNILVLNTKNITLTLLGNHPKLESVEIKKEYFHKLNIDIRERSSVGIWCSMINGKCYYFDKDGVLYDNAPDTSGFLLFNVKDARKREIRVGDKVESQIWIDALVEARQKLTERGFQIKEIVIPEDSFDEFFALEARGWKIQMSINTNLDLQIKSMADFLKQKLSPEKISQLQYVDLRIEDRIYYK